MAFWIHKNLKTLVEPPQKEESPVGLTEAKGIGDCRQWGSLLCSLHQFPLKESDSATIAYELLETVSLLLNTK